MQNKFFIAAPFGNYIKHKNAISVKGTYTMLHRRGLIKQLFKTLRYDFSKKGWKNELGLRNPGIKHGLNKYKNNGKEIISIAAMLPIDWEDFARVIPDYINLEFNLSCPNTVTKFYNAFWDNKRQWCIAKISPLSTEDEIKRLLDIGFGQIHCSNTLPITGGGLSGRELISYTIKHIDYIKTHFPSVKIIAGGGINHIDIVHYYKSKGADYFSLGTVCFTPWKLLKILNAK
ncbi:MAG: hypothetical protein CXT73_00940 [Methanobacteriota archaeon]|nr:MAG: hypothetical protein CXT73_00940 [Euryarchaeota archaeon]